MASSSAPSPAAAVFAVNGERVELREGDVDPGATLLEFLRTRTRFTGPKLGCGEGTRPFAAISLRGCGACVVLISTYDAASGEASHAAASSCLTLVHGLHHRAVTTTEGLGGGGGRPGLHAVHERVAGFHASQCGFCTPGVCMSLAAALAAADAKKDKGGRTAAPAEGFAGITAAEAERAVAGNLCRCTGYRPIADACKSFAADVDLEDLGLNSFWRKGEAHASKLPRYDEGSIGVFPEFLKAEIRASSGIEECMPPALVGSASTWHRPRSVEEYYKLVGSELFGKSRTKVVVGNTASGVYREAEVYDRYVDLRCIPELNSVSKEAKGVEIGAAVSISKVIEALREDGGCNDVVFCKIADHMEKVASPFVRNTASLGGNLIMAQRDQFASDIATILLAAGSSICIQIIEINKDHLPVGIPAKKVGAELQASGEAVFVDDIPSPKDCLYGAFIYSTKPLAHVRSIGLDPSFKQLNTLGVVTAKDIPEGGSNVGANTIFGPEPLFGDLVTQCAGEPLGLVIAETQKNANIAAKRALIDYSTENLGAPILSIEEAVNLNSQYYFYMETQTALAIPDEDNSIVVYSSSQCPETTQNVIAKCLGLPCHSVRVITRRVGGGFGGKAVRSLPVAAACALAAFKLHRPVRIYLDRKTDMIMTGGNCALPAFNITSAIACLYLNFVDVQANMVGVDLSAREYYIPGPSGSYLNYGAAISEVEIDLLTGATMILRSDLIYDCGQSLNPAVDLGQVEGAFVQGIGYFMSEEYVTNSDGLVISDGTWTYKIPTVDTIPKQFNVKLLNSGFHKKRVLSSKASGEPPLLLAASVHCATRAAIRAAKEEPHCSGSGSSSPSHFDLEVPAIMPVVKELCGLENVERYLESLLNSK
nr:unnamed protein product [Digitaria exilis]